MGLLVGCYSPTFPENQPCSETQNCPDGLECDVAANECVSDVPETAHFIKLSTYDNHACGIDPAGKLFCWGRNLRAELGLGDTDQRLVPTRVGVESDWIDVQAGEFLTCGLRATDQLWCWGDGLDVGVGLILNPRQVAGSYTTLTVGHDAWCALETSGRLICRRREQQAAAEPIPTDIVPVQITTTHGTVCVIDTAKRLWCWGENNANQVGTDDMIVRPATTPFQLPGEYTAVDLGDTSTCAIATDGRLSCWGTCGQGQLGRGTDCGVPTVIDERHFVSVSAGVGQTCAIDVDGKMFCMGTNFFGELGSNGGLPSYELLEVEGFGDWQAIAAGNRFTCGLRAASEAWCWGDNQFGQLGDGGGGNELEPVAVDPGPFDAVFSGEANGCALREGTLWCWGANGFGQLGDGTRLERRRPVQIGTDNNWRTISITRTHACGIRTDGTLWCWGSNDQRQLGIGGNLDALVPTQVGSATGWSEIAVSDRNACGILDGLLHCWGFNRTSIPEAERDEPVKSLSAMGDTFSAIDTTTGKAVDFGPFTPPTLQSETVTTWTALERGGDHVCGLIGGELWCFGRNFQGQLGQPAAVTDTVEAIRESSNGTWLKASAGNQATCAIATDNKLACMGSEFLIGLGEDGRTSNPTTVGAAQWSDISVGALTTCGIQLGGSLHCWGFGVASGRGDGKGGHERPTRVSPP